MSTPMTTIYLCSGVRLDSSYTHTIFFPSLTEQREYFKETVVKTVSRYTYIRRNWALKVEATMEQANAWNYLFFHNGSNAKTYYYFINSVEYVNDNTVQLNLEMDVMQTYAMDYMLLPSFVERQHTETDVIGQYYLDEGLDVGELVTNGTHFIGAGDLAIMIMSTINPNAQTVEQAVQALPYTYNGVFSGVKIWAVHPSRWAEWGNQLAKLDSIGQTSAITNMWMYPYKLVQLGGEATWTGDDVAVPVEKAYGLLTTTGELMHSIPAQQTTIDGYTPRNKKLFCYPYNFAYCTNNAGVHAVYKYELAGVHPTLGVNNLNFALSGCLSPDGGMTLTPKNYDGLLTNYNESITLTGFPSCAWDSDIYKMWLAQNQGQQGVSFGTAGLKILGGAAITAAGGLGALTGIGALPGAAAIGGGISAMTSGIQQISGLLAQNHDRDIIPPQAAGTFSSNVNITNGEMGFRFYFKSVKAETARVIDDFFTMYGYKINRVQLPVLNARPGFTYIKTIGCNLTGNICNEDILKIKSVFDNGVTFWMNGYAVGDYNIPNNV